MKPVRISRTYLAWTSPDRAVAATQPLQLWGGIECSTVRVRGTWRDQVVETGHHARAGDLDRIAALGIRTLRYPILWERVTDGHPKACGWNWHDAQLGKLQQLGINVVGGLLHHGSGPAETSLLDPALPAKLARHAAQAAARYPFVQAWTPVNEPLTTARFSCLYGRWYPHEANEPAFLRALVNQCRAVLLSMRAIRALLPRARLIQTEDIGRIFSTDRLAYQADYENERRWLSLDLLCGRVGKTHPWRARLEAAAISPDHLDELASGEAKPDLIGVNHYVTSDRFLDHRFSRYPRRTQGGNGRERYADIEAARAELDPAICGWEPRLREVWDRYQLPITVTEAHLGCDDQREQVRWLVRAWRAAQTLRAEGADIRAVTAWALLGLVDWDSLLCRQRNRYEPGALDASADPPRPTLLAEAIRTLAIEGNYAHPALRELGWWERDDRLFQVRRRA
ncbi:MAG: family 1 glycosylhydrolase [Acetobacteraceae bacterium]|nr:family 1 glycosylhydrolase [Acetobacteraceae bacterium]